MNTEAASQLEEALGVLEKSLGTPAIAGEMPQWCETARKSCVEFKAQLEQSVNGVHAALLEEMFAEDPEQGNRVEQLKHADQELVSRTEALEAQLGELCDAAEVVEQDEGRVADRFEDAVQAGLQLVIDIRRQENALTTWHSESLKRDRGVVD